MVLALLTVGLCALAAFVVFAPVIWRSLMDKKFELAASAAASDVDNASRLVREILLGFWGLFSPEEKAHEAHRLQVAELDIRRRQQARES